MLENTQESIRYYLKLYSVISSSLHSTECSFCVWGRVNLSINSCTDKSVSLLLCYVITVIT